jgi:ribosomal protein S18 acetylase RimI-like enzyme
MMKMTSEPIEITRLSPDEWAAYRAIRLEALHDSPQAFGSTYADFVEKPPSYWQARLQNAAAEQGNWLYFARRGEQLVGIIGAYCEEGQPESAWVISVYVSPAARGQGVGAALMQHQLTALKKRGVRTAVLEVMVDQHPARALYQRCGFREVSRIVNRMGDGQDHEEIRMEQDL